MQKIRRRPKRREARVELVADALEGDVDHRRVEQGEPRPEHRRQQDPAPPGGAHPDVVDGSRGLAHRASMTVAPVGDEVRGTGSAEEADPDPGRRRATVHPS
jgi:hypothetical protein